MHNTCLMIDQPTYIIRIAFHQVATSRFFFPAVHRFLFCLLLVIFFRDMQAQGPFRLSPVVDHSAVGAGLILETANYFLWEKRIDGLTAAQLGLLDPLELPPFDRFAIKNYSVPHKQISDVLLLGSIGSPALLLLDPDMRKDRYTLGLMYAETLLLTHLTTTAFKQITLRPRPFAYNDLAPLALRMKPDARYSFFSGHVSLTAAASFFSARTWCVYHPDAKGKAAVWAAAAALPAFAGYLRIRSGKHFLSDVVAGYIVGAAAGWLIPAIHRDRR